MWDDFFFLFFGARVHSVSLYYLLYTTNSSSIHFALLFLAKKKKKGMCPEGSYAHSPISLQCLILSRPGGKCQATELGGAFILKSTHVREIREPVFGCYQNLQKKKNHEKITNSFL